ncbi:MAG: hypothetical protein ACKV0T_02555, partial [Planctomycetales bacterium]
MRYSDQPQRELAAWFLPGADPMNWIAQAADCGIVLDQARLYVVSQGPRGGQPLGVLLLSGNHDKVNSPAQSEGHSPSRHGNPPIPYGCLAGKLYLPLEGLVSPLVTDSELSRLFPADCEALIWHPIAGLIGFEPGDRLSFGQLLLPPVRVESQWDRAQPGSSCNHRLRSVTPTIIPTVEFVLEQGQDDIGSQAQELSDLPPAPNETTPSPLGRALAGAASTAAG